MENEILVPGYGKMTENALRSETWVRMQLVTDANVQGNYTLAAYHANKLTLFLNALAAHTSLAAA